MTAARTLHVRCNTWEQVEVFHTRKLRHGRLLSMKVPFQTEVGVSITLGLELPNQVVMAIDGTVRKASPIEGDTKTWIEVELSGFTEEVIARIRAMATGAEPAAPLTERAPAPAAPVVAEELPGDERQLFQRLTGELRRLRQAAVHDALGVPRDASPSEIRRGWMNLVRRYHPDLVARHHAPAITHLAEELTILSNRAYDRLRAVLVAEGRATVIGPGLERPGWLVGIDEFREEESSRPVEAAPPEASEQASSREPVPASAQGSDAFESRARVMLSAGDADNAREVLAAALCVYPRSRPLRSLYYVATAMAALQNGELMLATSQLETALAHHEQCVEGGQGA
jgi:DnaJ-domain-containing protein 1